VGRHHMAARLSAPSSVRGARGISCAHTPAPSPPALAATGVVRTCRCTPPPRPSRPAMPSHLALVSAQPVQIHAAPAQAGTQVLLLLRPSPSCSAPAVGCGSCHSLEKQQQGHGASHAFQACRRTPARALPVQHPAFKALGEDVPAVVPALGHHQGTHLQSRATLLCGMGIVGVNGVMGRQPPPKNTQIQTHNHLHPPTSSSSARLWDCCRTLPLQVCPVLLMARP